VKDGQKGQVCRSLRHGRGNPDTGDTCHRTAFFWNNLCEAYTAHRIGHRGRPRSPEVWYSLVTAYQQTTTCLTPRKSTQWSRSWREAGGSVGVHRAWHVRRDVWKNLGDPVRSFCTHRRYGYPMAQRMPDGGQGVGQPHSTRSPGKPDTGGRGLHGDVACTGNMTRA